MNQCFWMQISRGRGVLLHAADIIGSRARLLAFGGFHLLNPELYWTLKQFREGGAFFCTLCREAHVGDCCVPGPR
jgi:hypothetical protein